MSDDRLNVEQLLIMIWRTCSALLQATFVQLLPCLKLRNLRRIHVFISSEWCALGDKHLVNTSDLSNLSEIYTRCCYYLFCLIWTVGRFITGCSSLPFKCERPLDSSVLIHPDDSGVAAACGKWQTCVLALTRPSALHDHVISKPN